MSSPIAQGYRSNSRLLTQGFGGSPSVTPLTAGQQSVHNDGAAPDGSGDKATQTGGKD